MANATARALRKRLTPQEVKLWVRLRELRAARNLHFRRQAPVGKFIVDFASLRDRIVIEVDGGQHAMPTGIASDRLRDSALAAKGFRILRFWNSDIDSNLDGVVATIVDACDPTPARTQVGCCRLASLNRSISGKPEIDARRPSPKGEGL